MSRRAGVRRACALLVAALGVLTVHMLLLASSRPLVHTARLAVAGWPAGTPPLRVALLSDIHTSAPSDTPARLAGIVTQVDGLRPDLILLAGDFLGTAQIATRHYPPAASIAPLAALHAPLGVLAVPGNHDRFYHALGEVRAALAAAHIPLLINQGVRRGPLAILGFDDLTTGHRAIARVMALAARLGGIPIALTHDPGLYLALPHGIDIRFAGHTHCGQISPPPWGPIVMGSAAGRRYVCGLVREGERVTIVTGGIGTSILPLRLGAAPDLWLIELGPPA